MEFRYITMNEKVYKYQFFIYFRGGEVILGKSDKTFPERIYL